MTTQTLDQLQEALTVCTDPAEYDRLQAAIREAEKTTHLTIAAAEVARRQRQADTQAANEAKFQAAHQSAKSYQEMIEARWAEIFQALTAAYDLVADQYNDLQTYQTQRTDTRYWAEKAGQAAPPMVTVSELTNADTANLAQFFSELAEKYTDRRKNWEKAVLSAHEAGSNPPPPPDSKDFR